MRALSLILALSLPFPAFADCAGELLFSCPIKAARLEVCLTGATATYSFGPAGKPDLTLETPVADLDFQPWPGIGRAIWQTVRFHNRGVVYEVWSSLEKQMEENQPEPAWQGGVTVQQGDQVLAELSCSTAPDPSDLDLIFQAKEAAGQCWNYSTQTWQNGGC
ncbi:hypothetical protein [Xinfangfangia pollutisoli]|uniref:hypothetical protein n=1 Tax=Xinfangfangia pollutisoli TaxID=2865960 RepID=UPI001CD25619|nr:hypothetical protein [Xinfangfangia pollutisoli]